MRDSKLNDTYKGTHFRVVRAIFKDLIIKHNCGLANYDLMNMTVYKTQGTKLAAENVRFTNLTYEGSPFRWKSMYEIWEVPHIDNEKDSKTGKFLMLARDCGTIDGGDTPGYYLFLKMDTTQLPIKFEVEGEYALIKASTSQVELQIKNLDSNCLYDVRTATTRFDHTLERSRAYNTKKYGCKKSNEHNDDRVVSKNEFYKKRKNK